MKLPFWEEGKSSGTILGTALDSVFSELCDRKQAVLLATPYLHYESRFLAWEGRELKLRATMSRDAVKHALAPHPLRLRFDWALTFFSGPTRVLRYVQEEERRYLWLEPPNHLVVDEPRRALRLDRVGRSSGALGSEDGTLLKVTLENLSALGAGVFCLESIPPEKFQTGRTLDLSLSLEAGPAIRCRAKIRHGSGQSLGLDFQPALAGQDLENLLEWLAPKHTAARRRWENRAELRARAEQLARPRSLPLGVLLVSTREDLKAQVASALEEALPFRVRGPGHGALQRGHDRFAPAAARGCPHRRHGRALSPADPAGGGPCPCPGGGAGQQRGCSRGQAPRRGAEGHQLPGVESPPGGILPEVAAGPHPEPRERRLGP